MLIIINKSYNTIQSRMWGYKKGKNAIYEVEVSLRVSIYSELTIRSIDIASKKLNKYFFEKKNKIENFSSLEKRSKKFLREGLNN